MSTSGGFTPPAVAAQDFWRTPAASGALPDGVTDVTETVARSGPVGVGLAAATPPVASVDVSNGARTGTHPQDVAGSPGYFTGTLDPLAIVTAATPTPATTFAIVHDNGTQGIGITYNGIAAVGSNASQDFILQNRGSGQFAIQHQALLGGFAYLNHGIAGPALAANEGWRERWFANGALEAEQWIRRSTVGAGLGNEDFTQRKVEGGGIVNARFGYPSVTNVGTYTYQLEADTLNDAKLVLFGNKAAAFFGLGIKGSTLASFVSSNAAHFRYYQGASPGTQVFGVSGVGNVTVDPLGVGGAGWVSPVLRFGGEAANSGIRSQITVADRFQNGIETYTGSTRRFAVLGNGRLYASNVPTFGSNALALAGGLATGEFFKDALGVLRIVL